MTSLLFPITLCAMLVFIDSSLIHMVLPYHCSDHPASRAEDQAMEPLRRFSIAPGAYVMRSPAARRRVGVVAAYVTGRALGRNVRMVVA